MTDFRPFRPQALPGGPGTGDSAALSGSPLDAVAGRVATRRGWGRCREHQVSAQAPDMLYEPLQCRSHSSGSQRGH